MNKIELYEVGPRDGFQNITQWIPTEQKCNFIKGLADTGLRHIQVTAFVSPAAVPQMQDAEKVAAYALSEFPQLDIMALVPNLHGARAAQTCGLRHISNVISLSESHNKANINRTRAESVAELARIRSTLPEMQLGVDIATAFGCPFEGRPDEEALPHFVEELYELGIREFCLCDTIGVADPKQIRTQLGLLQPAFSDCTFLAHIHDTRGLGIVCTLAAIEAGINGVQTTLGGLGGCPFAPGASGNTATEDLVYLLNRMDYDTGVDFTKLLALARQEHAVVPGVYSGHHINIKNTNSTCF
jgi:hydroxymethylglutaryl-CoA lyase